MPDRNPELILAQPDAGPPPGMAVRIRRALSPRSAVARLRHPIARNAAVLYLQQAASYILPIITIPYLARVLGPHAWGVVVFAQGFSNWLSRLLEYGFNLSATREVAARRTETGEVADIVCGVLGAQALLVAGAGLASIVAALTVPSFQDRELYVVLAWLAAIAQGLNPLWFYQGFEDMRLPALLSVTARLIATGGVFVLVTSPEDGWIVLALQVVAGLAATGIAIGMIYRRVPARLPTLRAAWGAFVQGWRVFLLRGSITLYSTANVFLLGLFVPPNQIAFYGAAERITNACYDSLSPISQALFPHMSRLVRTDRKRAERVARNSLFMLGGVGLMASTAIFFLAPVVVRVLLGAKYVDAIPVLRIMSLIPLLAAVSNLLGVQWMVPLGLERQMNRAIVAAGLFNVMLVPLLAPRFGALGAATAVVCAELVVTLGMYVTLRRLRLDPFAPQRRDR